MADDADTNATTTTDATATIQPATPPAVQPSKERLYTQAEHQAEVDRIVKKRLGESKVEPKVEAKAEIDPEKLSKKDLKSELDLMRAEMARDRARLQFDKAALKLGVPDEAADDLFELHDKQKPEDTKAWLESKHGRLWTKAAATPTPPMQDPKQESTAKSPVTAPNAPTKVDPLTSAGIVDIFNLSAAQLDQLGPQGLRKEFEAAIKVGHRLNGAPPRPVPAPQRK